LISLERKYLAEVMMEFRRLPLVLRDPAPVLGWAPPVIPRADDNVADRGRTRSGSDNGSSR
jgi:hypothetical protein